MSIGFFTSHFWSTKMRELERVTYIAAPFFNDEQKNVVECIEEMLDAENEAFFSPREYGIITDGAMTESQFQRIFDMNIRMLNNGLQLIAVTDDFDPGVMFEIGYFYSITKSRIITFSPKGYGSNVMIAKASWSHCRGYEELELAIRGHQVGKDEVVS